MFNFNFIFDWRMTLSLRWLLISEVFPRRFLVDDDDDDEGSDRASLRFFGVWDPRALRCGAPVRAGDASRSQTSRAALLQSAAAEKLDHGTHGASEFT